jgi:uncharacterized protein
LKGAGAPCIYAQARRRPIFAISLLGPIIARRGFLQRLLAVTESVAMNPILSAILLLTASNVFMTFAWYAHLRNLGTKPLIVAVLASWGIAFFEYLLQVPANRIGFTQLSLPQLKMLQEVISLSVFVPFSIWYMHQPVKLDFLWAALCLCSAVCFMFRGVAIAG